MKCVHLFPILFGIFLPLVSSLRAQFYRKDYTYFEEFDAFYKIHWDLNGKSWNSAFLRCDDEESVLFYPKEAGEWIVVKNLTNKLTEQPNVTEIFVGIHDEFKIGEYITVDGHPTPHPLLVHEQSVPEYSCVLMDMLTQQYRVSACIREPKEPLPFVCKKVRGPSCPTIDQGYIYTKSLKKCYKINERSKTWEEAMQTCYMEGGILAVIENEVQKDIIRNLMTSTGSNSRTERNYFVGVRRLFSSDDFYTVTGKKFTIIHNNYDIYGNYIGNGNDDDTIHECGIFQRSDERKIKTVPCGNRLPFICEMDVTA